MRPAPSCVSEMKLHVAAPGGVQEVGQLPELTLLELQGPIELLFPSSLSSSHSGLFSYTITIEMYLYCLSISTLFVLCSLCLLIPTSLV